MKLLKIFALAWLGFFLVIAGAAERPVLVVPLAGAIGPAGSDFVSRNLDRAEKQNAQLVVLQMDTPGGLDTSMRQIIKAILSSSVPVAVYVAPSGARAASAGTYIMYASHIAAMAPGTNLGAATPVQIGVGQTDEQPSKERGRERNKADTPDDEKDKAAVQENVGRSDMSRKQVHDAAAYIRGLAQMRGRNADWAERAVREAVSLSAEEALQQKVIDLVATDIPDLLRKLQGRRVVTAAGERTLETSNAEPVRMEPDWKTRFLATITDPSVALILMMIGIYGLFFEFYNPGFVLPGVVGAICLLLALFAFHLLPINYAGLALIGLGLAFMIGEAFLPSFGVLGMGGVVAFAIGAVMLIDTELPGYGIPFSLIAGLALVSAVFLFVVVGMALRARRRPVVTGREQLAGESGIALEDIQDEGWIRVHGEQWWAHSVVPVKRGEPVRVVARSGLVLTVAPVPGAEKEQ